VCKQLAQGCTGQRGGRDWNPQPVDRKSGSLTTLAWSIPVTSAVLTDFQNSFMFELSSKFATRLVLNLTLNMSLRYFVKNTRCQNSDYLTQKRAPVRKINKLKASNIMCMHAAASNCMFKIALAKCFAMSKSGYV